MHRTPLRQKIEEKDDAVLIQEYSLNIKEELERTETSRQRLSPQELLTQFRNAYKRADELTAEAAKQRGRTIPVTVFRLPRAAYEVLRARVGLAPISAADRLLYGKALARLDAVPTNPLLTARAFAEVREAQPSASEEQRSLVGEIQALILAEQQEPGAHFAAINRLLAQLRAGHAKSDALYQGLLLVGDALLWHKKQDQARPLFQEAVDRFGDRAVVAKNRLERLTSELR